MSIVYILGISTYGGFEAKDATLNEAVANAWLQSKTDDDTMPVFKKVDWEVSPAKRCIHGAS